MHTLTFKTDSHNIGTYFAVGDTIHCTGVLELRPRFWGKPKKTKQRGISEGGKFLQWQTG